VFRLAALALLLSGSLAPVSVPTNLTFPAADEAPAWSADGRQIAFARYYHTRYEVYASILVLHVARHPPWASRIPGFLGPTATPLAWAPDSRRLGVGYRAIDVFDTTGERVGHFDADDAGRPLQFRWSPDGGWIAVFTHDGLTVIPVDGGTRSLVASDALPGISSVGVVWSPDSTQVGFITLSNEIALASIDRSMRVTVTKLAGPADDLTLSPDGRTFAVTQYIDGVSAIWLVRADGFGLHWLTNGWGPSWSPNGKSIVFTRRDGVWKIGANGRGLRHLVTGLERGRGGAVADQPEWSPHGGKIAYVGNGPHCRLVGIFWMNADGTRRTRLTNGCG
jgi:Tol biopolymer transport system component